jgi:hypothetical protein
VGEEVADDCRVDARMGSARAFDSVIPGTIQQPFPPNPMALKH